MSVAEAPLLEVRGVEKVYPDGTRALSGVDLEVGPGETLALVGESGCGKTTLLRLFNRMVEPTAGTVRLGGRPVGGLDPVELRRGLGYVPQEGGLIPHWRIERNVALVPRLLGWERRRRGERAREMMRLVGLDPEPFARRYPRQLSGGQRQRAAIARALAADPEVILLDEPFGALDALTRLTLQEELVRLKARVHKTMVLVTHDLDEAFRLADRIAVMRRGQVLATAPPAELEAHSGDGDGYVGRLLELRSRRGAAG